MAGNAVFGYRFSCWITCCGVGVPTVAALEEDGQIILGVFLPIIVIVIAVVAIRMCWEWRAGENQEHYTIDHDSFTEPSQPRFEAPTCTGNIFYTNNRQVQVEQRTDTAKPRVEAPKFTGKVVYASTRQKQEEQGTVTVFLDNVNENCNPNGHPFVSESESHPSRERQATALRESQNHLLHERSSISNDNFHDSGRDRGQSFRLLNKMDHRAPGQKLLVQRFNSVRSANMELWMDDEGKICAKPSQRRRRSQLEFQQRTMVKRGSSRMKHSTSHGMRNTSIKRDNTGERGNKSQAITVQAGALRRSTSRHGRRKKSKVKRRPSKRSGALRHTLPKIAQVYHSTEWSCSIKSRPRAKPIKSCLKVSKSQRASKNVRFRLNQVIRQDRLRRVVSCNPNYLNSAKMAHKKRPSQDTNLSTVKKRANSCKKMVHVDSIRMKKLQRNVDEIQKQSSIQLKALSSPSDEQDHSLQITGTSFTHHASPNHYKPTYPLLNIHLQNGAQFNDVSKCHAQFQREAHRSYSSSRQRRGGHDLHNAKSALPSYTCDAFKLEPQFLEYGNSISFSEEKMNESGSGVLSHYSNINSTKSPIFCTSQSSSTLPRNVFDFHDLLSSYRSN